MSTLICTPKYGGCGYIGSGHEWKNADDEGNIILCPLCCDDHAFQLTDGNFDSLMEGLSEDVKQQTRERLDKEHADIHGDFLKFCIKEGFVSEDRLTPEQQEELTK